MTTFVGKTAEEAIQEGLLALHVKRNEVEIKLIEKPRKGFFGIGKRDAKIEMVVIAQPDQSEDENTVNKKDNDTKAINNSDQLINEEVSVRSAVVHSAVDNNDDAEDNDAVIAQLIEYLGNIVVQLGVKAEIEVTHRSSKLLQLNFKTNEEGLLIGKHGLTINALQSLAEIYLNRFGVYHLSVELDTADYRQRRIDVLEKLAERTARDVVANGQPVYLDPMPSFERKTIHKVLEHSDHVRTYSAGREPHRAVVVAPK